MKYTKKNNKEKQMMEKKNVKGTCKTSHYTWTKKNHERVTVTNSSMWIIVMEVG